MMIAMIERWINGKKLAGKYKNSSYHKRKIGCDWTLAQEAVRDSRLPGPWGV